MPLDETQLCGRVRTGAGIDGEPVISPDLSAAVKVYTETLRPENKNWLECQISVLPLLAQTVIKSALLEGRTAAVLLLQGDMGKESLLFCVNSSSEQVTAVMKKVGHLEAVSSVAMLLEGTMRKSGQLEAVVTRPEWKY